MAAFIDPTANLDTSLGISAVHLKVAQKRVEKLQCGDIFICSCSIKKRHVSLFQVAMKSHHECAPFDYRIAC